jgi:hypothetical protein
VAKYIRYESSKLLNYTVSYEVGYSRPAGRTNAPDDVLLIQFFLNGIFASDLKGDAIGDALRLDGIFGRHTHYHLLLFQRSAFQFDPALQAVSGTVAPTTNGGEGTMKALNDWYFHSNPHIVTEKDLLAVLPPLLRGMLEGGVRDRTGRVARGVRYG